MGLGKPMSLWKMNETTGVTVADTIGANTGTATSGNARRFNGTSDYVQFSNPIIPLGAKTVRFKVRKNGVPASDDSTILDNSGNTTGLKIRFGQTSGHLFVSLMQSSQIAFMLQSTTSLCDNIWHEIMFTWDGTTNTNGAKLFVDDMTNPVAQATATRTETVNAVNNLRIGADSSSLIRYLAGDLDDLQITNGYMGAGTEVAHWKMDEAGGNLVDSGPSGYTGTVTGTTVLTNDSMPIIVSDGAGGYCRRFNGRSDRITFTSQVLPLGAKSIRFKIRTLNSSSIEKPLIINAFGGDGTWIAHVNGQINFSSRGTGGATRFSITSSKNISDGQWHEILCTWDGSTNLGSAKIFIDDMSIPDITGQATSLESANASINLFIGTRPDFASFFEGDLKDITISIGTGTERTDPKDMQIGDFIACSYTGVSNAFGSFSGLGIEPASFIPPVSKAAPNGEGFYFICVDEYNGKKVLISDRNCQSSISWDSLNAKGVSSGSGLPITIAGVPTDEELTVRLLTGGVDSADAAAGNSEWDNYIVKSSLGGTITPGNLVIWNLDGTLATNRLSWTSTTQSTNSTNRIMRGRIISGSTADFYSGGVTNYINVQTGFRPVLLVESVFSLLNKSLLYFGGSYQKYADKIEGDMVKDLSYVEEGTLLSFPLNRYASKVEVV